MSFLKSRAFLVSLGVVLLLAVVVGGGFAFGAPPTLILLGVIVVLVLCLGVIGIVAMRAGRAASGLKASLRAQAKQEAARVPENRGEIERAQEQFERAVDRLKGSRLAGDGPFRSGTRALYALPWYVMIGPPGAGKTTALVNSGLRFPAGTDRVRGVGGTRNCDWFFSSKAILLDTAGRYTTEAEDQDEWFSFLDSLKKHRPRRPANGVLVAISLSDLIGASQDEIQWHAETVRKRIDELLSRLGVRLPVYVLFTKADLVQGFAEFFGDLGRKEREQVWGRTFAEGEATGHAAETAFRNAFGRLAASLTDWRNEKLNRELKREERHRVYAFPLEFATLEEPLAQFVDGLFLPNPFGEEPLFRGVYFTSGTQEGAPIDRVVRAMAARFDLPETYPEAPPAHLEPKSYFLKELFTEIVIPDQHLVRPTGKAARKRSLASVGAVVGGILAFTLFGLAVAQAAVRSRAEIQQAKQVAAEAAAVQWADQAPVRMGAGSVAAGGMGAALTVPAKLARLDALRAESDRMAESEPISLLGLGRRRTLAAPLRDLYADRARGFVETYALAPIMQSLRSGGTRTGGGFEAAAGLADDPLVADPLAANTGAAAAAGRRQRVYNDLRAYLLLTEEASRLGDDDALRSYLKLHLGALAQVAAIGADTTGRGQQAEAAKRQAVAYVDALARGEAQPFAAESGLVASARREIYEPPSVAGIYNRIKEEALVRLDPFTLTDAVPGPYLGLFEGGAAVPGAFTRRGWEEVVRPAFRAASQDPNRDDWVMDREGATLPDAMSDPEEVRAQLQAQYFREYVGAWERFMGSVRYAKPGTLADASRALRTLSSTSDSPLLWLLAVVTDQTTLSDGLAADAQALAGDIAEGVADQVKRQAQARTRGVVRSSPTNLNRDDAQHPVDRAFAGLHQLKAPDAPSGQASAELYAALEAFGRLADALGAFDADPAGAADYAAQVMARDGGPLGDALRSLESAGRGLPTPVRDALLTEPVDVAWGGVLAQAQRHLDSRWREAVYDPYRATLAERFPLDPRSQQDVPVQDFERFFAPTSGAVAAFRSETLAPFMTTDGRGQKTWRGRGLGISSAAQRALDAAGQMSTALFRGETLRLEFEMQADVPEREGDAPPPSQVTLRAHGTSDAYRMGSYRPWVPFAWPGEPGAAVGLSTREGELPPKRFDGDWAIFRLLADADVRRTGSGEYAVRWTFRQPGAYALTARYGLRSRTATGPFADAGSFFRFTAPPTLSGR